ncbi:MAG: HNH endonuclease [Nitrospirae bacterium]|nr:HNH endonuclease [Nitrospirota bacterium]
MKGYIANTDYDWYLFLQQQTDLDEVNFWQPSGGRQFKAISKYAPFFFKLKKPYYAISGFGYFRHFSIIPARLAWDTFGHANGAPDFETMNARIEKYRKPAHRDPRGEYGIGCIIVTQPTFFSESDWIPQPKDWGRPTVQGATFDLTQGEGKRIWEECRLRTQLERYKNAGLAGASVQKEESPRYGEAALVTPRLGQGAFRIEVLDAYGRSCAVTREHTLPVLEAAHIKPYAQKGDHAVPNGLLLRSDIHALFDRGYVTVTPDHRFEVSQRLKQDFDNGKSYYPLHGNLIHLPGKQVDRPDPALLEWHNSQVFRG